MSYEIPDNLTMSEQAALMHEFYISLTDQGFTKSEAMHIMLQQPCCNECGGGRRGG